MKIGIDFDRVLFDTDSFREELESRFSRFSDTYTQARTQEGYKYRKHAELLGVKPQTLLEELENAENFVYSDIHQLDKIDNRKVLVSRGHPTFQRRKIKFSGVMKHFNDLTIVQAEPKDVADIDFLVDDSKEEIERVQIPCFHFQRPENTIRDIVEKVKHLDES